MSHRVLNGCVGCGICELACPTGAVLAPLEPAGRFEIDPLRCGDCGACAVACPVGAIALDPTLAVCRGWGCPLASRRHASTECTQGDPSPACPRCGGPRWRTAGGPWTCPTCAGERGAHCPRPGQLRRSAALRLHALAQAGSAPAPGPPPPGQPGAPQAHPADSRHAPPGT